MAMSSDLFLVVVLTLYLLIAKSNATPVVCPSPTYSGTCFQSWPVIDSNMEDVFCHDSLSCLLYDDLFKPMGSELGSKSSDFACVIDVEGDKFSEETYTSEKGCSNLPAKDDVKFRVLAGSKPILGVQSPSFCMAVTTECTEVALGLTGNADAVAAFEQVAGSSPLIQNLLTLLREQLDMGLPVVTAALGTGGFEINVKTFSPAGYQEFAVEANVFMDYTGTFELPFLDFEKFNVVSIEGKFSRSFDFGVHTHAVLNQFSLHPLSLDATFLILFEYPEVTSISGKMSVGFDDLSGGLLPNLEFVASANAYKMPCKRVGWDVGFYMSGESSSSTELSNVVNSLCAKYEGAFLEVAGVSCPTAVVPDGARVGVFIQEEQAGFSIEATVGDKDFSLECRVILMNTARPGVNCQFGDVLFQLVQDASGIMVNKIATTGAFIGDKVGMTVLRLSHATFDTFNGISKNAAKVAKQVGTAANMFGFLEKKTCSGTEVLWSTSDPQFDRFFFQYGHGDTIGHCFNSCVEHYLARFGTATGMCCQFKESGMERACSLGAGSSSDTTDSAFSATSTFINDYKNLVGVKEAGETCDNTDDCYDGICVATKCFKSCTAADPCFPGEYSACGSDNNGCINVGGHNHYCDSGMCVRDPLVYNEQVQFRIDHETYFVSTAKKSYSSKPAIFASLMSTESKDPADVRVSGVTNDSFDVNVQEETSRDRETKHSPEAIGYLSFALGNVMYNDKVIGEVGRVEVEQASAEEWHTLTMNGDYTDPLVFMMTNTFHGADPVHMRIRSITSGSFEYQLEEWSYMDGQHIEEEVVYLVIEKGLYPMEDGSTLAAYDAQINYKWKDVGFPRLFEEVPAVLSQVQTTNDGNPVVTRMKSANYDSISIMLQVEQKRKNKHGFETVAVLAYGKTGDLVGKPFAVLSDAVDHDFHYIYTGGSAPAAVFSSIMSMNSGDTADPSVSGVHAESFYLKVQEEQSRNEETKSAPETMGYFTYPLGEISHGGVVVGEVGTVDVHQEQKDTWFEATLSRSYSTPVVVMLLNTANGVEPCHIRLNNVQSNKFQYKVEEWAYLDGIHLEETAVYMVLEAGVYVLESGMTLEAFRVEANYKMLSVNFPLGYGEVPVVLSQTQTFRDSTPVNTRKKDVSADAFKLKLDEEERSNRRHETEVVGFITYGIAEAPEGGALHSILTDAVDENLVFVSLGQTSFTERPAIFAAMMNVASWDTAGLRVNAVTPTSFMVKVQEETSRDSETNHPHATVGYFSFPLGELKSNGVTIGEVGRVTFEQPNRNQYFTMTNFLGEYVNPVVIMMVNTINAMDPVHPRVRNVKKDSFEYKMEEWAYQGGHHAAEDVVYMIVEMGAHRLENGLTLEAFFAEVNKDTRTVEFPLEYAEVPIVVTQIMSTRDTTPANTRVQSVTKDELRIRIREEDRASNNHAYEKVGFISYGVQNNDALSRANPDEEVERNSLVLKDFIRHYIKYVDTQNNYQGKVPAIFASTMSENSGDVADIRIAAVTTNSFFSYLTEEKSRDSEFVVGNPESLAFIPLVDGPIVSRGETVGFVGRMKVTQLDRNTWFTLTQNDWDDIFIECPVALIVPNTFNEATPVHGRIRDVKSESFEFQLEEWAVNDGKHQEEEVVFMVIEEGVHPLPDGNTLMAWRERVNKDLHTVTFPRNYTGIPVIIAQTQTTFDRTQVITRLRDAKSTSVRARLREEQRASNNHGYERVGFVTFGKAEDGQAFQDFPEDYSGNKQIFQYVLDEATIRVDFTEYDFTEKPAVFASAMTGKSSDAYDIRINSVTETGFLVRAREESSRDAEFFRNKDIMGFFAFEDGPLVDEHGVTIGIVGRVDVTQPNRDTWFTMGGFGHYTAPIVLMMINTYNDITPCRMRLNNVKPTSFQYKLEEWDVNNGEHKTENVVYMVVEEGTHILQNGMLLQAFRVQRNYNKVPIQFPRYHGEVPVVVSQVQTFWDRTPVMTFQELVTTTKVDVRLKEQERNNQRHGTETIGFITYGKQGGVQRGVEVDGANEQVIPLNENVLVYSFDHQVSAVDFLKEYAKPPAILANVVSQQSGDPVNVRITAVTTRSFFVSVQEEQSRDSEINHPKETVNYLAFDDGLILNKDGVAIGEVGRIQVEQGDENQWFTFTDYKAEYVTPVVTMVLNTNNGYEPCHMRVRNVRNTTFEYQLEEWDYLNGKHSMEVVAYLIAEEGLHELANGMTMEVFRILVDHNHKKFNFPLEFTEVPVVLTQTQTWLTRNPINTRVRNVKTNTFEIELQEEERNNQRTNREVVAAITYGRTAEPASLVSRSNPPDLVSANILPYTVNHDTHFVYMQDEFQEPPAVFADMMTMASGDPADTRVHAVSKNSFYVEIQEETSRDWEINHARETVGFLNFPVGPLYSGSQQIGEVGRVAFEQPNRNTFFRQEFSMEYKNPVILMQINTNYDVGPGHIRLRVEKNNVLDGLFEYKLEEWAYQNGKHGWESAVYLIVEEGIHVLPTGVTIQAFRYRVNCDWKEIFLPRECRSPPIVIGQSTTLSTSNAITTRVKDVTTKRFKVELVEEERNNQRCNEEILSFISYGYTYPLQSFQFPVEGSIDNKFLLRKAVNHDIVSIDLREYGFAEPPAIFASLMSMYSGDTADIRVYVVTDKNFFAFVEEEKSRDFEVRHNDEDLGYWYSRDGPIKNIHGEVIGEVGRLPVSASSRGDWHTLVELEHEYTTPVVIMQMNSRNGFDPAHMRLDKVTKTSFAYLVEEWHYQDGKHHEELGVYLIMEEGTHQMPGGYTFQAFRSEANHAGTTINFPRAHTEIPVVFAQTQTYYTKNPVVTRMNRVGFQSVKVYLEEEERNNQRTNTERMGLITFGKTVNVQPFQLPDPNSDYFTQVYHRVLTHNQLDVEFPVPYATIPVVFANLMSTYDGDVADLKIGGLSKRSFYAKAQEEKSRDAEIRHNAETFGYIAFETDRQRCESGVCNDAGLITDVNGVVVGEFGRIPTTQQNGNQWFTVGTYLNGEYSVPGDPPIVIMVSNSDYDRVPGYFCVKDVWRSQFKYQFQEWDHYNGQHGTEMGAYLIVTPGVHQLANGIVLQAFKDTVNHQSKFFNFPQAYTKKPVVLSQTQTENDRTSAITRKREVSTTRVRIYLQEQQRDNQRHGVETVGVITYGV